MLAAFLGASLLGLNVAELSWNDQRLKADPAGV